MVMIIEIKLLRSAQGFSEWVKLEIRGGTKMTLHNEESSFYAPERVFQDIHLILCMRVPIYM